MCSDEDFRIFSKIEEDTFTVFRDKGVLDLSYVPEVLVRREKEEEYFAGILARGVRDNFLPPMVRVFGRPGSGKTAVVRSVLDRFSRYRSDVFRYFYVNLKSCGTVFSAGNAVLSAVSGRRVAANLGLDRVFSEIWNEIRALNVGGRLFVCLVLDESDSVFLDKRYDPSYFFYRFIRHRMYLGDAEIRVCLVVITNNPRVFDDNLDDRVKSSMGSDMIMFPPYSKGELFDVLLSRVDEAFIPGGIDEDVVNYCAELVAEKTGDARRAIDLLRVSGEIANERGKSVDISCVKQALDKVEKDWIREEIETLPMRSALILGLIAFHCVEKDLVSTRELYDSLRKVKMTEGFENIRKLSERRILDIIVELETVGLISTWNVSRGRGGFGKEIKLNSDPRNVVDIFRRGSNELDFHLELSRTR